MHSSHGIALCCTTHSLGGIELNVLRLAAWMTARGHRCLIVAADGSPLHERATTGGIPSCPVPARSRYRVRGTARRLARTLEEHDIHTLILNVNRDLLLGVLTKRAAGNDLALLHTQHMQFGHAKTDFIHRWQHRQLDAWIAPLPSLAEQTRRMTHVPAGNIHIIPFGIELAPLRDAPGAAEARAALRLPADAFIAGTVGRLDRGKGQEYLIRAAARLRADGRDVHVLLVGEETRGEAQGYARELRTLAEDLHITDLVHYRGFIQHVGLAYAAMDVFALTSLSETYGMVTIEAMASGRPVIATDSGGTPDLVSYPESGRSPEAALLVPPADPDAIARMLLRLMEDREFAAGLGQAARRHAQRYFSHESQCAALEQLIELIHR
jgi:D-inositol-3-phosphate glycosyltransferase